MHTTRYVDEYGNVEELTFPVAITVYDEPCLDGFEQVVNAANYDADIVLMSDWLGDDSVAEAA